MAWTTRPTPMSAAQIRQQILRDVEEDDQDIVSKSLRGHFNSFDDDNPLASADIDIFFQAPSLEAGEAEVLRLVRELQDRVEALKLDSALIRSNNTITVISGWPRRNIQLVNVMQHDIAEAITWADLDITACAWDGHRVLASPRCVRALRTRCNMVTPSLQFRHLGRAAKYAARGFEARVMELCSHTPRCDVQLSPEMKRLLDEMGGAHGPRTIAGAVVTGAKGYDSMPVDYGPDFTVRDSVHGLRTRMRKIVSKGDAPAWRFGTTLPELFPEGEEATLEWVRWRAQHMATTRVAPAYLPRCLECGRPRTPVLGDARRESGPCKGCAAHPTAADQRRRDLLKLAGLLLPKH